MYGTFDAGIILQSIKIIFYYIKVIIFIFTAKNNNRLHKQRMGKLKIPTSYIFRILFSS